VRRLLVVSLAVAGALLLGGVRAAAPGFLVAGDPPPLDRPPAPAESQPDTFFQERLFFPGLEAVRRSPPPTAQGPVVGGLVPHHTLAGSMFSRFFVSLETSPPGTVIVVGPNHDHRGQKVITGRRGWSTPFGVVASNEELVSRLVTGGLAVEDEEALGPEHSVGALMAYVKYHAPAARVVPLILHRTVTRREMERLAEALAPLVGPQCVLVASVDFSHYLTRRQAEANDQVTMKAILDFDLDALMGLDSTFVDSPPSLGVLMLTMQRIGAQGPEVLGNTNSGVILGSDSVESTSYFTLRYAARAPAGTSR